VNITAGQGISLETPKCEPGIGEIIRTPDSADTIDRVQVRPYDLWPDDRGYFLEAAHLKQGLDADFAPETTQISAALSYPRTIKAFHFHSHQTGLWIPSQGMFQVARAEMPFEAGLRATIDWYRGNAAWIARIKSGDYQNYYQQNYAGRAT
jgi:hypothetical protein